MAITIGDAVLNITGNDKGLQKALDGVNAKVKVLGKTMLAAGTAVTGMTASMVKSFTEAGDMIGKMSKRTGISVENLSRLRHAAELSGSSIEDMEKSIRKMQQTMLQAERGQKTYIDMLGFLGLTYQELQGRSVEDQFLAMLDALANVADASRRAAIAAEIFGRSGTRLLPMLEDGSRGLRQMMKEADTLGVVFDQKSTKMAEDFKDMLLRLRQAMAGIGFEIARVLVPDLNNLINSLKNNVLLVQQFVRTNKEAIVGILKWGPAVAAMGGFLMILPFILSGLAALISPIGLVGVAIAAVLAKIAIPKLKEKFAGVLAETKAAKEDQKKLQRITNAEQRNEVRRHYRQMGEIENEEAAALAKIRYGQVWHDEHSNLNFETEEAVREHFDALREIEAKAHAKNMAELVKRGDERVAAYEVANKKIAENHKTMIGLIRLDIANLGDITLAYLGEQFGPAVTKIFDTLVAMWDGIQEQIAHWSPAGIIDSLVAMIDEILVAIEKYWNDAWSKFWGNQKAALSSLKDAASGRGTLLGGSSNTTNNNITAPITINAPGVSINEAGVAAAFADAMRFGALGGR